MKVIGVDPAPKKAATIFDGKDWATIGAEDLPHRIDQYSRECDDVLVCWDAPLTTGKLNSPGCFYSRQIERFFCQKGPWKAPKGISVLAYAGCPHWAVSRASLGLPRMGRFDSSDLPFILRANGGPPKTGGRYIVEVHPAVAIWLWCQAGDSSAVEWRYKGDISAVRRLWTLLQHVPGESSPDREPANDDELDAYVAWLLGHKWLTNSGVTLLGNEDAGSFLVPAIDELIQAFAGSVATWTSLGGQTRPHRATIVE